MRSFFIHIRQQKEKGQAFVEFGLVLVLLLILLAGVVDLGRAFYVFIMLRDAAMEGIAYGSAFPTHCNQIEDRIIDNLTDGMMVDITIEYDNGVNQYLCKDSSAYTIACTGSEIRVTVSEPDFPLTMPLLGTFLGRQTINLTAEVSGTVIQPPCGLAP